MTEVIDVLHRNEFNCLESTVHRIVKLNYMALRKALEDKLFTRNETLAVEIHCFLNRRRA